MKTILVTGGAGFIGSHACKALARAGYCPVTFDSLENGHEWAVKWGPLEIGHLHRPDDLQRVFAKYQPSAVMHFAAYACVGESIIRPVKYYLNNAGGTAHLLSECLAYKCRAFVFSSSCATFGHPSRVPIEEDDPQNPINPYGYSKLVAERMLQDAEAAHGLRHVILRYFNAAGSDPEGEIGEVHLPETHLIPIVLSAAKGQGCSVRIYGNDYDTPDGTCIRDYVHVSDLADAHVAAIKWLDNGNASASFNLGNGRGFSVSDVIDTSEKITGRKIAREVCARRPGDPPILVSDSRKAHDQLKWNPHFPDLETQIRHAWRWTMSERMYES